MIEDFTHYLHDKSHGFIKTQKEAMYVIVVLFLVSVLVISLFAKVLIT